LVRHFVRKFSISLNRQIDTVPEDVMELLEHHDWPGNIRELQNFIERAVVMSPGSVLRPPLMELKNVTAKEESSTVSQSFAAASRDHILEVLNRTEWMIGGENGAAACLGLPRTTLIYKMRKLGIEPRRSLRRRSVPLQPAFAASAASPAFAAAF
jgi:formate hydrogenlyase transcriptional activator